MKKEKKIIIDTDIGDDIDDAYAIALAVRMRAFDILGVTTVYRNSWQRAKIASALLGLLGREDVGVYAGEDYPRRECFRVEEFEEKLPDGRPVIPHYSPAFADASVREGNAAAFIAEQAEKYPGEISVMAIGPFTNLAEAAEKYPSSFRKLSDIVCMGGSFAGCRAEWNIRCDPESAALVLETGVPMTFIGIDVTSYTYLDDRDVRAVTSGGGRASAVLGGMLQKWMRTHPGRKPTMHDALTIAEAAGGGFCGYGRRRIRIPLGGEDRARTVFSDDPADPVVSYATGVDREGFLRFFEGTLRGLGEGGDKLNYFKNISDHPVIPEGGKE